MAVAASIAAPEAVTIVVEPIGAELGSIAGTAADGVATIAVEPTPTPRAPSRFGRLKARPLVNADIGGLGARQAGAAAAGVGGGVGTDGGMSPVVQVEGGATSGTTGRRVIGVSASGGGIRSAAFTAGVLYEFVRRPEWDSVAYLSCVSGGGYTGSAFADWSHQEGATVPPALWMDRFVDNMRQNTGYLCTWTFPRIIPDMISFLGSILMLLALFFVNYGPSGILTVYLIDLVFGDILRGLNPAIPISGLILIVATVGIAVWILRKTIRLINSAVNKRLQNLVDMLFAVELLVVSLFLLLAAFWVEYQMRLSIIDEFVQASFIVSWLLALGMFLSSCVCSSASNVGFFAGVPWLISRTLSLQVGFFLLCTAFGRLLMWRVLRNTLLYVIPYTDSTVGARHLQRRADCGLTLDPALPNNVCLVLSLAAAGIVLPPHSGVGGCGGMLPSVFGCGWMHGSSRVYHAAHAGGRGRRDRHTSPTPLCSCEADATSAVRCV